MGKYGESNVYLKTLLTTKCCANALGLYANNLWKMGCYKECKQIFDKLQREFSITHPIDMACYAKLLSRGLL